MLGKCLFVWGKPSPRGSVEDAQIILTQANSDLVDGSSSRTNKKLAAFASCLRKKLSLPIHAQGEVGRVLLADGVRVEGKTFRQEETQEKGLKYLDTFSVAVAQKRFCDERKFKRVIPVAPVPHIWRVIWVYEKLGFEVIVPPDMPTMVWKEEMKQGQWRAPGSGYVYEFCSRLMYWYKGQI